MDRSPSGWSPTVSGGCRRSPQQLGLAVAGNAGNADDLAGAHVEGNILDHVDAAAVAHRQVRDREHRAVSWRRALLDAQQHATADHELGQLLHRGLGGGAGGDHLARRMTETASVAAMISRSLWVISTMVLPSALSCLRMRNR
jgi:hypothetical protein